MKCFVRLLVVFFLMSASLHAQAKPLPPEIQALKVKLLADKKTLVTEPFEKGVAALNANYIAAIDRMIQAPPKTMHATELPALRQERDDMAKGVKMPPLDFDGTPYHVETLRRTYRAALFKLAVKRDLEWDGLKKTYLKAAGVLQMGATQNAGGAALAQRPSMMDIYKDIDFMAEPGEKRIVGRWKITQSDRTVDEWTFTSDGPLLKAASSKSQGWAEARSGYYKVQGMGDNKEWSLVMKNDLVFRGTSQPDRNTAIYGERIWP